jgi:hypothetical protein
MNFAKDKISTKLDALSDFWETHTAPMTQTTLGSAPNASDVVAGMDPTRVRFYLQVVNRLPKFKQILREYNLGSNLRDSWYSAIRDINSKAILNTNRAQLDEYHVKKNMMSKVNEINTLKEEVAEIKDMMQKILTLVSERK